MPSPSKHFLVLLSVQSWHEPCRPAHGFTGCCRCCKNSKRNCPARVQHSSCIKCHFLLATLNVIRTAPQNSGVSCDALLPLLCILASTRQCFMLQHHLPRHYAASTKCSGHYCAMAHVQYKGSCGHPASALRFDLVLKQNLKCTFLSLRCK